MPRQGITMNTAIRLLLTTLLTLSQSPIYAVEDGDAARAKDLARKTAEISASAAADVDPGQASGKAAAPFSGRAAQDKGAVVAQAPDGHRPSLTAGAGTGLKFSDPPEITPDQSEEKDPAVEAKNKRLLKRNLLAASIGAAGFGLLGAIFLGPFGLAAGALLGGALMFGANHLNNNGFK